MAIISQSWIHIIEIHIKIASALHIFHVVIVHNLCQLRVMGCVRLCLCRCTKITSHHLRHPNWFSVRSSIHNMWLLHRNYSFKGAWRLCHEHWSSIIDRATSSIIKRFRKHRWVAILFLDCFSHICNTSHWFQHLARPRPTNLWCLFFFWKISWFIWQIKAISVIWYNIYELVSELGLF